MTGWGFIDRPCVTLGNAVFRGLIGGTGAKKAIQESIEGGRFVRSTHAKDDSFAESTRITVEEAAALQTYPPGFTFCGTKGKVGLQIGNAVPPLLAEAILAHLWGTAEPAEHVVLDLFAGTGVGVALQRLGVIEHAVEIMPEAIATRRANDMDIAYEDVWDAHLAGVLPHDTEWASPPCPTFSAAGKGSGRRQMPLILGAIEEGLWKTLPLLRAWAATLEDERSGLTLVPLYYLLHFTPTFVVLEQVPAVLPIWEAYAVQMRAMGYSVWTGKMHCEQYGVPQTRQRAILIARRDGVEATPPAPTHSRYYSHDPKRLDPGVAPWVSMEQALGTTDRPTDRPTRSDSHGGRDDDGRLGTVRPGRTPGDPGFTVVSNYGTGGDPAARGRRMSDEPSATITSKFDRNVKEPT